MSGLLTIDHTVTLKYITRTRLLKNIENFTSKNWKFSVKNADIFHNSGQNTDRGYSLEPPRRGGSNEYPQSMFLSRNKKNNVYPCKTQFYYIKWGLRGSKLYRYVFVMRIKLKCWGEKRNGQKIGFDIWCFTYLQHYFSHSEMIMG